METIQLTDGDIEKCRKFASEVTPETYDRLGKDDETREFRIFVGKVGELAFLRFLNNNGINPDTTGMFDVFEGPENTDKRDFETSDGKKIDVKTAYAENHVRILVPEDQFERKPKDFYVGVKADLSKNTVCVHGFCSKEKLEENGKIDFGEKPAYWEYLSRMRDIKEILVMFQ